VNLVYRPDGPARGWVVWLHGGPHEQVSPRYNPYFDALVRQGLGVVALNYPGSTGVGNEYELRSVLRGRLERQLDTITRDLEQVRALHPDFDAYYLVGVSAGSVVAQGLLGRDAARVRGLIDFSGIATEGDLGLDASAESLWPPALFIYGALDPYAEGAERKRLLALHRDHAAARDVVIDREGHYISRRSSVEQILREIEDFVSQTSS